MKGTPEVNKKIADQWVADLRSGDFLQGTGALRGPNPETGQPGYCCLGVLAYRAIERGGLPAVLMEAKILHTEVCRWAGMTQDGDPHVPVHVPLVGIDAPISDFRKLSTMNDAGTSFAVIANLIEQNWESL
jgi:hypothetical protein